VPNRWELEQIALLINVEPARKKAGFRTARGFVAKDESDDDLVSSTE
jgi:hypothetical protein